MSSSDPNLVKSLFNHLPKKVPDVSITDFLFESLDMNYELLRDQIWVADVSNGSSYSYSDIKPLTRKIASGLTKLGFKKGDVLCFATTDVTLIHLVHLSVWICGGVLQGFYTNYDKEFYEQEMRKASCRFVLCDTNTMNRMKWASEQLQWDVIVLSIGGNVKNTRAIEDMIANDDCSCYPNDVKINPKEDVCIIANTSGSTGRPKGVLHTHHNVVACFSSFGAPIKIVDPREVGQSLLTLVGNQLIISYLALAGSFLYGFSILNSSKFHQKTLLELIAKYKPETIFLYPIAANLFIQAEDLAEYDLSSVKYVLSGGSVFTEATAKSFADKLPNVHVIVLFGMTEFLMLSHSAIIKGAKPAKGKSISGLAIGTNNGCEHVTCGQLLPLCEAKIVDPMRKCTVGRNTEGHLWVRVPGLMKGYLDPRAEKGYVIKLEEDGWFDTGDIAYFDENDYLYIVDRSCFIFTFNNKLVSPSDIEAIIMTHPAVSIAGVTGVPNAITTTFARAYVVLKPNYKLTEEEMITFVAERADDHMQLHGGVAFIDEIPKSTGAKIDRPKLHIMAKRDMNIV